MSRDDGEGWEFDVEEADRDDEIDGGDDAGGTDEEWRFAVEDLGDDDEEDQSAVGGNIFGSLGSDTDVIEAGSPDLENVLFVALGVVIALVVFLQFVFLFI